MTGGVADALNLTYSRRLHFESVLKEMRAAALASKVDVVIAAPVEVCVDRLPEDQAALLVIIAEVKNSGVDGVYERQLPSMCGMNLSTVSYHLQKLVEADLLWVAQSLDGRGSKYHLSTEGSGWLLDHKVDAELIRAGVGGHRCVLPLKTIVPRPLDMRGARFQCGGGFVLSFGG